MDRNVFFRRRSSFPSAAWRLYELGQETLSTSNIYMCTSRELTAEAAESGCCFLCIHKMAPALKKKLQGRRIVLLEDEGIGLAEVFNTVQSLFTDLREWHQHMHVSLIQSNDVQELLDLSESAIGNPIVLVDLSFKLLAYTKNIKTDDEVYNEVVSRGYHTKQTIERLTNTRQVDSIKRASVIDIAFPLPQMTQYQTMTKTFFIKGVPYAYLRMICSAPCPLPRAWRNGSPFWRRAWNTICITTTPPEASTNICMNTCWWSSLRIRSRTRRTSRSASSAWGLQRDAEYQLLKIIFEDEDNTSLNYMLDQLLAIFPESRPFIYGDYIMILMSRESKYLGAEERKLRQFDLLRELLEYHKARCGMSEVFRTIRLVSDAYVQTTVAVEIGGRSSRKEFWWRRPAAEGSSPIGTATSIT